jgi:hypothetical protein
MMIGPSHAHAHAHTQTHANTQTRKHANANTKTLRDRARRWREGGEKIRPPPRTTCHSPAAAQEARSVSLSLSEGTQGCARQVEDADERRAEDPRGSESDTSSQQVLELVQFLSASGWAASRPRGQAREGISLARSSPLTLATPCPGWASPRDAPFRFLGDGFGRRGLSADWLDVRLRLARNWRDFSQ